MTLMGSVASCWVGGALWAPISASHLPGRGARVQAFGRSRIMSAASNEVTWMSGLFDDPSAVARAIEGNNIVFHLIGSSTAASSNRDPIADLNSGAVNTLKMLDICRESGVRRVIFASSGGTIYGVPRSVPIREDHPLSRSARMASAGSPSRSISHCTSTCTTSTT